VACIAAALVGAATVRVETTELAPGVTEAGEKIQVGRGAGPLVTAHVSRTGLVKGPFRPARVMRSVPCPAGCRVNLVDAGVSEKSCRAKFAVTEVAAFMVILQAPVPEQAPLQPVKFELELGVAVSVTIDAPGKLAAQVLPQLMPEGTLVTDPLPLPLAVV